MRHSELSLCATSCPEQMQQTLLFDTSSAIASSAGGTVSPSPLAALALMTRVDCYAPFWPLLELERTSAMRFTSQALG